MIPYQGDPVPPEVVVDADSGTSGGRTRGRAPKAAEIVALRIRRMIAEGELADGDRLPPEAELVARFAVSRPTLREAFRLLEGDSLVQIRRGPPGGARVRVPGPEAVAPLFGMLLTLRGTTLGDLHEARMVLEPAAARRLAERGSATDHAALADELVRARGMTDDGGPFAPEMLRFHQRLVELAGNHTMATLAGMLAEIIRRHTTRAGPVDAPHDEQPDDAHDEPPARRDRVLRTYAELVDLVAARRGGEAERLWRAHMTAVGEDMFRTDEADRRVVDLLS